MPKKNTICVTRKKKTDEKYVVCFDESNKPNKKSKKLTKKKKGNLSQYRVLTILGVP